MNNIIGFEACEKELQRLLEEVARNIDEARQQGADAVHSVVMSEAKKLVEFTGRTEPRDIFDAEEIENVRRVDQLADQARREIFGASADVIISRIQDRASQLNQLAKSVRQQTAETGRKAREIRLIPLRNTVDAMKDLVETFKAVRNDLTDQNGDEAALKSKIDSVVEAVTALEKGVRGMGV